MSTPPTRSARLASPSLPVALITVGTTKFESLTDTLERECAPFCAALLSHGVRQLVAQTGSMAPSFAALRRECARCGIEFESFGLTDPASFKAHVEAASLVISHAGAGSILETLRLGKALFAVVNERLQENHQVELAEALAGDGAAGRRYLYWSTCEQLCTALTAARFECLDRFPAADTAALPRMVDALMGFA